MHLNGEKNIGENYIDWFDEETNTVYQFYGCFYHGCLNCYSPHVYTDVLNLQFGKLNYRIRKQTEHLCDLGYNVIKQWECEFVRTNNLL